MKQNRRFQITLISINVAILALVFLSLFIYDHYFRTPPAIYKRPIVPMEKVFAGDNPYFDNYDRMDLFAQYKGTRAVGSEKPKEMVLLLAHPSFPNLFHFSHLLAEAYKQNVGLTVLDFSGIKNFIPLDDGRGGVLNNDERRLLFITTMIEYMEQYGFTEFRFVCLGMDPPEFIVEGLEGLSVTRAPGTFPPSQGSYSLAEESEIIKYTLEF